MDDVLYWMSSVIPARRGMLFLCVAICKQRPCGCTEVDLYLLATIVVQFEEELIQLGARTPPEEELRRRDLR